MSYKALLSDLDDTLYKGFARGNQAGVLALSKLYSTISSSSPEDVQNAFSAARDRVKARLGKVPAARSRRLYLQDMLEQLTGKSSTELVERLHQIYWTSYYDAMQPISGAKEALCHAKKAGLHVGIVTNMYAEIQYEKLRRLDLLGVVDSLTTSEEAGFEKPDPRIFEIALNKAKASSRECLFIGDEPEADIKGAEALGMRAVLIKDSADFQRVLDILRGKD